MARTLLRDALILVGDDSATAYTRGHPVFEGGRIGAVGAGDPPAPARWDEVKMALKE